MTSAELLTDMFGRIGEIVHGAVDGLAVDQLAHRRVPAGLLPGYHDATHVRTVEYVSGISGDDLGRVVDERRDPPVTLGVRLVSVVSDDLRHAGQAAFVRGPLPR